LPRTGDPAVAGTTNVTPGAAPGTIDFTYEYATLELPISTALLPVCIGGLCVAGVPCPYRELTTVGDTTQGPGDSPRIMYDATCDKLGALAGTCSPFEDFAEASNICATGNPGTGLNPSSATGICGACAPAGGSVGDPCGDTGEGEPPCVCADRQDCCDFIQTNYPTATVAQFPQVPINP
jgi:hypothetical protein